MRAVRRQRWRQPSVLRARPAGRSRKPWLSYWAKRGVLSVPVALPQYVAYHNSTRWRLGDPAPPPYADTKTSESRLGHNARVGAFGRPRGIWQWDLNRTHDDGFGWSRLRPGIPCSHMYWLALSR